MYEYTLWVLCDDFSSTTVEGPQLCMACEAQNPLNGSILLCTPRPCPPFVMKDTTSSSHLNSRQQLARLMSDSVDESLRN